MLKLPCVGILLTFYTATVAAGNIPGYHYEKPSALLDLVEEPPNPSHGHSFGPLSTVQPLPPIPDLPALPTPRSSQQFIKTQTIYQTHPAGSTVGKIAQQYQPPSLQTHLVAQQSTSTSVNSGSMGADFSSASAPGTGLGSSISNAPPAPVKPLRVPFGKQAVIRFPTGTASDSSFDPHARQLHQYAVIEIIDNDIEQSTQPYLNAPFFDSYRARAGSPPPLGSRLLGSRSSNAFLGQQLPASDAVALGSGGLGFIRLANGNVYLGSGSLGYVSGQQHTQEVNEARTRTGAPQPDALHFGHGPLGNPVIFNKISRRFK